MTVELLSIHVWKWMGGRSQHVVFSKVFVQKNDKRPMKVSNMGKTLMTNDV